MKNEVVKLKIFDINVDGCGVAKYDDKVYFVKNAYPDDEVMAVITKETKNVNYAKTIDVIKKSKNRVENLICDVENKCGGCTILPLDYDTQIKYKENNVLNNLVKIGKFDNELINRIYKGMKKMEKKFYFRNKMQVPFFINKNNEVGYGFYATRTHNIIENTCCKTGFKESNIILNIIKNFLSKNKFSIYNENEKKGIFREVMLRIGNITKEISVTFIVNDNEYKKHIDLYDELAKNVVLEFDKVIAKYNKKNNENFDDNKTSISIPKIVTVTLNINTDNNNCIFGKENFCLYGKGYITDYINDIKFNISPESFYQVNIEMTKKLYNEIIDNVNDAESVLDLYCGIGTITLSIAKRVKNVCGLELVEKAIIDAKQNAKINNITNAKFICIDCNEINEKILNSKYDLVIVDPPRKGLDVNVVEFLSNRFIKSVIYVSCNPSTLARDLNILCNEKNIYKLEKISCFDMFPYTMHVETVCLLSHGK